MSSLQELLAEEGFKREKKVKFREKKSSRRRSAAQAHHESIALPIYICHDTSSSSGKTFGINFPKHKSSEEALTSVFSSRRGGGDSGISKSNSKSKSKSNTTGRSIGPAIDEVAIRAVISILSGYVGQYLRDENFRQTIKDKCYSSCFLRKNMDPDNGIFANMELGIESIEKLVESPGGTKKEVKMKSLRNSIGLLTIVASLNSKTSKKGSTCGTPNSHLSACAQLYLSIVYKLQKNDRISARHLLQVFCDSPFLARTHLLPQLWEHFFLPHLLHLKIWYTTQVEFLSTSSDYGDREKKMKALSKVYNDQMDMGTTKFALYYKEWLKTGAQPPPLPSVHLPSRPTYGPSRRRSSSDSFSSHSSIGKSLYRAVFSPTLEQRSMDLDDRSGSLVNRWGLEEEEEDLTLAEDKGRRCSYVESTTDVHQKSWSQNYRKQKAEIWQATQKPDYYGLLTCRSEPTESLAHCNHMAGNGSIKKEVLNIHTKPPSDLSRAITTICSSDSLPDCEMAIRAITKAWLDSHGDPTVENTLSKIPVMEAMLEVLFASNDDEILELVISILGEFVTRKEMNGQIILNSDPQLDIFVRLLKSNSLFLKAAVLLYLVKPKAKQMISMEWVPLVLRVLEFGDQLQTLFTIQCSPQVAAYYFLDQLLTGFDEDKNWENARQVVSLGGLSLLTRRIEIGDICEKSKAASIIYSCIQADGRCRHYLASNLNKDSILALLVVGKETDYHAHSFALLTELLCLHRRTQRTTFLNGLISGWGSLNTMHIFLVYLQRARPEERPMVAAMLLQLDLMGDPLKCSVYREEVVEAIIAALDCEICNEKVQEQSARALLILGGRFSYTGEPSAERWLLKEAGFDDNSGDSFRGREIVLDEFTRLNEEEDTIETIWQRKAAIVLLSSGNKKLVAALTDSIANGIPCLARASLVTVSWITRFLPSLASLSVSVSVSVSVSCCSILVPQLIESLNYDKSLEERVLASFSLLNLSKTSGCVSKISKLDKELLSHLRNLSQVTWTANQLVSIITNNSRH